MSEWWTYSPENFLMFSARTYWRLLERHNTALWPAHIVAVLAGAAVLMLLWRRPGENSARITAGVLAGAWLVVALAYFWTRYATIHTGGKWFAAAFGVQAVLMIWLGVVKRKMGATEANGWPRRAGLMLAGAVVLLYPLLAKVAGRPWSQAEVFGLAPDPTVLATLGLLAALRARWWLCIVPVAWALFSAMTLWTLHAVEAWAVLAGLALSFGLAAKRRKEHKN
jgi:hypothetical protein